MLLGYELEDWRHTVNLDGHIFAFAQGERIHVEDSWKYSLGDFRDLAARAGFRPTDYWTDEAGLFSVHLLEVAG